MSNRKRSCLRKLLHISYLEALQHAAGVPNNDTVVVYGCEYCGSHHVGHSAVFHKIAKTERRILSAKQLLRPELSVEIRDRNRQRIRDLEKNLGRLKKLLHCTPQDTAEVA